jgi:serine/threonine protein kinase
MIGKSISHYKILEQIGQGGMGIVYKAEDTKLKRTVALKFLAPELTRDDEAKKRLLYEARAASSLDHANICSIYEIDETDEGQVFIAMAWYDGESLKKRIERGPLKLDEAIDIAAQMAAGLQTAHEKGIVHRDIKSANVIITSTGQVKIMDFGLAKISGQTRLTMTGTTMGTVAYMSPEQARGEKVDHRTDTWSLGVVMYEMITGQLPFKGDYEQVIVYGILNETPEPITGLRTGVPMELERIVNKLMAKSRDDRYQNVIELPVDLKNVDLTNTSRSVISTSRVIQPGKKQQFNWLRVIPWILAVLFAIITLYTLIKSEQSESVPSKYFNIDLPESAPLDPIGSAHFRWGQPAFALSPDGVNLVYVLILVEILNCISGQ